MRVTISVGGRFHAFDLAYQLVKHNHLSCLITSYPKFEVKKYGIPSELVCSIFLKELIQRCWALLPGFLRSVIDPSVLLHDMFDRIAVRHVIKSDIFVGFSSFSLLSLRRAKELGALTILERGSSHILSQRDILVDEYELLGLKFQKIPHPDIINKEISEYQEADYISVPSSFVRRSFLEQGVPGRKLIQIPYGVNLSAFHSVPKQDTIFRVVFAGGICIRKGVHYLLQAFSELALPNAELWLIGLVDDQMKPFLKKYAGTFRLIGKVPQAELYKYYSQGSVFCILSIEEGLALVQAQAMACGLPVIATTNTGAEDIIRDGIDGYIIPIRDVRACKERLLYLYENQDFCSKMGESARQRVSTGFTWDDYGTRMITAYQQICQSV